MAYQFEFITDDRFGGTKKKLQSMNRRLKRSIKTLDGVNLRIIRPLFHLTFENGKTNQWRITYIVSKNTKDVTWNDVFGKINKIKAPHYKQV